MERYKYARIKAEYLPDETIKKYNLKEKIHNGYVYIEIQKGMYGLPQAGKIANDLLHKRLNAASSLNTLTPPYLAANPLCTHC